MLALVLVGGAARAEVGPGDPQFAISVGGGFAYELVGINLALRVGHVEGFVGLGVMTLLPGLAAGVRWFPRDDGAGFFLGFNGAYHSYSGSFFDNDSSSGRFLYATLTPGYRLAWSGFFIQAAVGLGFGYALTFYDTPPSPTHGWFLLPDAMLALGFRF